MADEATTPPVSERTVEQLALLAGIEIDAGRRGATATQLAGLLGDANRLNRFMDGHREIPLAVRFHHPGIEDDS